MPQMPTGCFIRCCGLLNSLCLGARHMHHNCRVGPTDAVESYTLCADMLGDIPEQLPADIEELGELLKEGKLPVNEYVYNHVPQPYQQYLHNCGRSISPLVTGLSSMLDEQTVPPGRCCSTCRRRAKLSAR